MKKMLKATSLAAVMALMLAGMTVVAFADDDEEILDDDADEIVADDVTDDEDDAAEATPAATATATTTASTDNPDTGKVPVSLGALGVVMVAGAALVAKKK